MDEQHTRQRRDDRRPKVTIVTPTYNREQLLAETIESILAQSWTDFEYLIIDDGSTDGTAERVRRFEDPRIVYLRHDNMGEAATVDRGWALARGEYVAVVSSDDPVLPGWLEASVRWLDERPQVIVSYPDWSMIDEKGQVVRHIKTIDYRFEHMVGWLHTFPGPGALVRRSALPDGEPFRTAGYRYASDLDTWLRLGLRGPFSRIPLTLATWRAHPTSISVAERSMARARELVQLTRSFFARDDVPEAIRRLEASAMSRAWAAAAWVVSESHPFRAALFLRRSYRLMPQDPPDLPPGIPRLPCPTLAEVLRAGLRRMGWALPERPRRPVPLAVAIPSMASRAAVAAVKLCRSAVFGPILYVLLKRERGFFDTAFYHRTYPPGRFAKAFPALAFAFSGAWRLYDPNPDYSQRAVMTADPAMRLLPPVFSDVLPWSPRRVCPPAAAPVGVVPVPSTPRPLPSPSPPAEETATIAPPDRFDQIWPRLAEDMQGLRSVASSLTPTSTVRAWLSDRRRFPAAAPAGAAVRRLLAAFPTTVDHLVLVPWLGMAGGSERVSQRLIAALRAHYGDTRVCVLGTDAVFDLPLDARAAYGVPIIAINDAMPDVDQVTRQHILDRILIELLPGTVHNVNSYTAWQLFAERAADYAVDMNLFVNIYSDIRIDDGVPVGYYWNDLPYIVEHLAGVFADNRRIIDRAAADFGLTAETMARFHYVPTPIVGLDGGDARQDLRPFTPAERPHALWMSRIAFEKRLDVVESLAKACPERQFIIYGAVLPGARVVDMGWTRRPNVDYRGTFDGFADLPLDEFDAYVFTTSAEGMPLAVMEAAMLGLPIVAPDVGGIGEFVDGQTGWLVSAQDAVDEYVVALDEIRHNPDEARRRVRAAQARLLERHSWQSFQRLLAGIPGYLHDEAQAA